MTEDEKNILLQMHQFYSEEARHQRSMMWETVKWFALILGIVLGIIVKYLLPESSQNPPTTYILILLVPIGIGSIVSLACIILIKSFYRTNLINISTIAKIEDELDFNKRTIRCSFRDDPFITWRKYTESRHENSSKNFVLEKLKYKDYRMHTAMSAVMITFLIGFILLAFGVFAKAGELNITAGAIIVIFYIFAVGISWYVIERITKK
jgi:F0F1-type ATP synthase assembly protein I